jgi:hypothetical protein
VRYGVDLIRGDADDRKGVDRITGELLMATGVLTASQGSG